MIREEAATSGAHSLGSATLTRLARLETHGHPVLSVYIDLDPERYPTAAALTTQLGSLLDRARRDGGEREAARVRALLHADGGLRRAGRGLAIFSCEPAAILETVALRDSVEPLAIVDTIPWLEPLAAAITPGDWGVAVISRRTARLFRGGPSGLTEFAAIDDALHRRHAQGGWSQSRFQRGIEEQVAAHVRGVAERLLRAHRRRPFGRLALVCSDQLRPVVEHSLPGDLKAALAATVAANLEHATVQEIARALAPEMERVQREREHDLIARLDEALGTGGPGAAGLGDVLAALEQQRVESLLAPERSELKAWLCPACGRLSTDGGGGCAVDWHALAAVNAVEYAIDEAARQSAEVVIVRHQPEWLQAHGEIAALLRW
jgi:peptide chain release factor subunit 1